MKQQKIKIELTKDEIDLITLALEERVRNIMVNWINAEDRNRGALECRELSKKLCNV
jgi:hypothetical protein